MPPVDQPPTIIEIPHESERHDVKAEVIEQVARLLCAQDGKNPDGDWRLIHTPGKNGGFDEMLAVNVEEPANRNWYQYRDKAERLLRDMFRDDK